MLIIDIPKEYFTDKNGILSCTKCRQYFPLLSKECSKHFYGCLIKGELIHCGECRYKDTLCPEYVMNGENNDWFCADGERKDDAK